MFKKEKVVMTVSQLHTVTLLFVLLTSMIFTDTNGLLISITDQEKANPSTPNTSLSSKSLDP